MAKSALLKSSIVKKYWMALTGLFLCLFLAGHLAGNLQLIFGTSLQFNEYALFMTTNPAVKILSYLTYISILFHAIDGILLTFQNKAARPIAYAKTNPSANSSFASRNMAVLGTIILVFIVTHMVNFWAKMHFDENMPLVAKEMDNGMGQKQLQLVGAKDSPMKFIFANGERIITSKYIQEIKIQSKGTYDLELIDKRILINKVNGDIIFIGYKDLHKLTFDFFRDSKIGLLATIGYVLAMLALAFHLWHGFQSAFQSLGATGSKLTPAIKLFGKLFSVIVPLLFAIIPIYIHFSK
jgi:succinate dehydrogenase / fumarate reductase cytochrome b subunit